MTYTLQLVMW